MSKFQPDGYTIEVKWTGKDQPPMDEGDTLGGARPTSFSLRAQNPVEAVSAATPWIDKGYQVMIYQTINLLVFNSDKDKKLVIKRPLFSE